MEDMVTLIFTPLRFYSKEDEDLFFNWLEMLPCIKDFKGMGRELHVNVTKNITFNDYKNFRGMFKRYKFKNTDQIKLFMNETNKDWFE
jgi:hypothetical protein